MYAYCENNPVMFVDPTGMSPISSISPLTGDNWLTKYNSTFGVKFLDSLPQNATVAAVEPPKEWYDHVGDAVYTGADYTVKTVNKTAETVGV
jgi:hypothetical protein